MKSLLQARSARNLRPLIPYIGTGSVLDIGAAEGWNAQFIQQARPACDIRLLDVVNLNRTQLPFTLYDGYHIPFADSSFETVLILLTLHHCRDPGIVLSEAVRVSRRRLIITESVYNTVPGRRLLWLLDTGFNSLRSGRLMPEALHFKKAGEWRALFAGHDLDLTDHFWLSRGLHKHIAFIVDKR